MGSGDLWCREQEVVYDESWDGLQRAEEQMKLGEPPGWCGPQRAWRSRSAVPSWPWGLALM